MDTELRDTVRDGNTALVRIAAMGDVHAGTDSVGRVRPGFQNIAELADLLLIAGDLTQHGREDEGKVLAAELAELGVPTVAVLGNHDYHGNAEDRIRLALEQAGVRVLENEGAIVHIDGYAVGIAGTKGFGGGFAGACGTEFGEPEMKAFIRHTKQIAAMLRRELLALDCHVRIALTHYSPIKDTLSGERLEIFPFLGSYLLEEAIEHTACDLAVHGHAHRGTERGVTASGIPVRNVARPVLRSAYKVYNVAPHARGRAGFIDAASHAPPPERVPRGRIATGDP